MDANIRLAGRSYCVSKMAGETTKCRSSWRPNLCILATLFIGSLLGLVSVGSYLNRAGMFVNTGFGLEAYNSSSAALQRVLHVNKNRKLLGTDRIADTCTKSDISIFQGHSSPLPNGIPTYTVQIINLCVHGCPISAVHVSCGWFASAKLVNPKIFRRLKYNDCLVNDGKPIKGGDSISFQYANSFEYPMRVESTETCQ